MLRIVVYGLCLIALLITVKSQQVLQRAHLVGSCSTVAHAVDGSEWRSCVPGRLSGRPGLRLDSCTDWGLYGTAEYWNCPAELDNRAQPE
jgi:hypothetical protein